MTENLDEEHARLLRQMDALRREHEALETRPGDVEAHREHRARLRDQIEQLHRHEARLRGERQKNESRGD